MSNSKEKEEMLQRLRTFLDEGVHGLYSNQLEMLEDIYYFLKWRDGDKIWEDEEIPKGFEEAINKKLGDFLEVISATSSGKTRAYGTLIKIFNVPTIVTTPRILLNEQTVEEFIKDIGIPKHSIGICDSSMSEKDKKAALKKPVLVTTADSLRSLNRDGYISDDPDSDYYRAFAVIDETHERVQGENTSVHVEEILGKMIVAGFSATDGGAHQTLFRGQAPIYYLGPVEAIEENKGNIVSRAKGIVVDVDIKPSWLKAFKLEQGKDYPDELLKRLTAHPAMIRASIDTHFNYIDPHIGPIYKFPTVFSVRLIKNTIKGAEKYNEEAEKLGLDLRAEHISGAMTKTEQKEIFDRFKAGEINALWTDKLIGLGTDISDITIVHMLKPSRLSGPPTQLFGRAFRKQDDDYLLRFGCDKVALGISYRLPGMSPFTANDVLNGQAEVYNASAAQRIYEGPEREPTERIRGIQIHSSPSVIKEVVRLNKEARDEEMGIIPSNWMTIAEASELLDIELKELTSRVRRIDPTKQYSVDGFESVKGEEATIAGSDLVRKRYGHGHIVSSSLISAWESMKEEGVALIKEGYKTLSQVAKDSDAPKDEIQRRLQALRKKAPQAQASNNR